MPGAEHLQAEATFPSTIGSYASFMWRKRWNRAWQTFKCQPVGEKGSRQSATLPKHSVAVYTMKSSTTHHFRAQARLPDLLFM